MRESVKNGSITLAVPSTDPSSTIISSKYTDSTIEQLINDKDSLRNGFYIVNKTDIVIVKDHEIINMFKEGVIHGIDGKNGADGKSAYELYCDTVPEGETPMSKEEWLESLKVAKLTWKEI